MPATASRLETAASLDATQKYSPKGATDVPSECPKETLPRETQLLALHR